MPCARAHVNQGVAIINLRYHEHNAHKVTKRHTAEEEEEEDLFVFNDTVEGPRAPAVSQGASLKPDESEGCSPVSGGRTIRLCSLWPSDDHRL